MDSESLVNVIKTNPLNYNLGKQQNKFDDNNMFVCMHITLMNSFLVFLFSLQMNRSFQNCQIQSNT